VKPPIIAADDDDRRRFIAFSGFSETVGVYIYGGRLLN